MPTKCVHLFSRCCFKLHQFLSVRKVGGKCTLSKVSVPRNCTRVMDLILQRKKKSLWEGNESHWDCFRFFKVPSIVWILKVIEMNTWHYLLERRLITSFLTFESDSDGGLRDAPKGTLGQILENSEETGR